MKYGSEVDVLVKSSEGAGPHHTRDEPVHYLFDKGVNGVDGCVF